MRSFFLVLLFIYSCGVVKDYRDSNYFAKKISLDDRLYYEEQKHLLQKPLPVFNAVTTEGDTITSQQLKGKRVFINLWFSKCGPCIAEIKHLNKLMEYYEGDVEFISMTYEQQAVVDSFINKWDFKLPVIADFENYYDSLCVGYPTSIFVDRRGYIQAIRGSVPLDFQTFMNIPPHDTIKGAFGVMADCMDPSIFYELIDALE